jgi:NADH-quinone oxidoreductase subunit E
MGYETVREQIRERLGIVFGETSADGQFTLLPASCLGACDHAPVMMIDDELYLDLTPEKIDGILKGYR